MRLNGLFPASLQRAARLITPPQRLKPSMKPSNKLLVAMRAPFAILLALIALAACDTIDNTPRLKRLEYVKSPGTAMLIFSAGASEKCITMSTALNLFSDSGDKPVRIATYLVDSYNMKSDFSDEQGNLHLQRVVPGKYFFTANIVNPAYRTIANERKDFSVKGGDVIYFGEFFLDGACGASVSGHFRDKFDRDTTLLFSKNPSFQKAPIASRVANDWFPMSP